jgi:2-keto-4-pentenoate hydratase
VEDCNGLHWQQRFLEWAGTLGFLDSAGTRNYEREFSGALAAGKTLPLFSTRAPTLADAYTVQKRLVRRQLRNDPIAGFKGAAATPQAQASMGIDGPLTGVLFQSGRIEAADSLVLPPVEAGPTMVETEIGFITGVDISYGVLTDAQARDAVASIVPVIELPVN